MSAARTTKDDEGESLMKKVRYVIGAVGAAPALGLMMPAAKATAAVTHPAKNAAKTVSLAPDQTCGSNKIQGVFSANGRFHGAFTYSGVNCIHRQYASLNFAKTGLTERVRYYSGGGGLEHSAYLGGKIFHSPSYTFWSSYPNFNAHKVCEALVLNGNHKSVKYGPLCETA
jgi:hypothetical protein